jgi:16S rRNA (cytosine1402-N4)-methyltransferase
MGRPSHTPVLLAEAIELLRPAGARTIIDCTVGTGGHAAALLDAAGNASALIAMDVDEGNLSAARDNLQRFEGRARFFRANFSQLPEVLRHAEVASAEVILADLGVSSTQLDDPRRGLSFLAEGPLDMRLDDRIERTAADLVNKLGEKDLADLVYRYGEERYSRRIARAIVVARKASPVNTTTRLAEIVAGAMPPQTRRTRRGVHPATRTFQALRIAVNDEMANLEALLEHLSACLSAGGRAGVISFHSLEDRPVKQAFARLVEQGVARGLTSKAVTASPEEQQRNPRSRSAKLRVIEKLPTTGSEHTENMRRTESWRARHG